MRVVGLDLSLTSTGMSDGTTHRAVQTGPADGSIERRIHRIMRDIHAFMRIPAGGTYEYPDLAVIEGAAYGARGTAVDQLAGLRWYVRTDLTVQGIPFAIVTPTSLKLYTTGSGRATKAGMVAALDHRYGTRLADVKVKDGRYDMADALGLAAMGYDHMNVLFSLTNRFPAPHRAALDSVEWPFIPSL